MKKIIYHGSDHIIKAPTFHGGRPHNDYGYGFYCTENSEMAKEWAVSEEHDGYANRYELDIEGLRILNLNRDHSTLTWLTVLITCEHTEIELIVRDHDSVQFAVREEYLRKVTEGLNRKYGKETVTLEIHEQYRSMKEVVEKVPCLVDHLVQAIRDCVLCRVGFRSVRAVSGSF